MTVSANKGRHTSSRCGLSAACQMFFSRTNMRGRSCENPAHCNVHRRTLHLSGKLNPSCDQPSQPGWPMSGSLSSFIMLTSCAWQSRSAPKCVRRLHLLAVASVPPPSLDKTCTQSLIHLLVGLSRLRIETVSLRIQTESFSQRSSNANVPRRITGYFLAGALDDCNGALSLLK